MQSQEKAKCRAPSSLCLAENGFGLSGLKTHKPNLVMVLVLLLLEVSDCFWWLIAVPTADLARHTGRSRDLLKAWRCSGLRLERPSLWRHFVDVCTHNMTDPPLR